MIFNPGEQISYGVYFNWNFVWLQGGEVLFKADTIHAPEGKLWKINATGKTFKTYDLFHSVRDTFEVLLNYNKFSPVHFRRAMNHARKKSLHEYVFDYQQSSIYSYIKRRDEPFAFRDTLSCTSNVRDLLSTAYYFRAYNFSGMKPGQQVDFKMLVDNKQEDLYFTYLGKEQVKTREGERFRCHKVLVMLLESDFFERGEYMKIWFSDDQNKLPVIVETKVSVGSVKAVLRGYENLKFKLTSKIEEHGKN